LSSEGQDSQQHNHKRENSSYIFKIKTVSFNSFSSNIMKKGPVQPASPLCFISTFFIVQEDIAIAVPNNACRFFSTVPVSFVKGPDTALSLPNKGCIIPVLRGEFIDQEWVLFRGYQIDRYAEKPALILRAGFMTAGSALPL